MSKYLLALACFVLAVANVAAKGCCTPDQWQGLQASLTGYVGKSPDMDRRAGVERGSVYVFYDFTNQRTAAFANFTGDSRRLDRSYRIVRRYSGEKEGMMYVVDLKTGKCYKKELTKPFRAACIPDEAKEVGPFYYGAGDTKLDAVAYMLGVKGRKYRMEATIAVTREGCVPIGESIIGVGRGVPFMENVGFVDIRAGISDPAVFDVPSQCVSQEDDKGPAAFFFADLTYEYKHLAIV